MSVEDPFLGVPFGVGGPFLSLLSCVDAAATKARNANTPSWGLQPPTGTDPAVGEPGKEGFLVPFCHLLSLCRL